MTTLDETSQSLEDTLLHWTTWTQVRQELLKLGSWSSYGEEMCMLDHAYAFSERYFREAADPLSRQSGTLFYMLDVLFSGIGSRDAELLTAAVLYYAVRETKAPVHEIAEIIGPKMLTWLGWLLVPLPRERESRSIIRKRHFQKLVEAPQEVKLIMLAHSLATAHFLDSHFPNPASQKNFYRKMKQYILPQAEPFPRLRIWVQQWCNDMRHLEPAWFDRIGHAPGDNATPDRRHLYVLTYHDFLHAWVDCRSCGSRYDAVVVDIKDSDNPLIRYYKVKLKILIDLFDCPLTDRRTFFPIFYGKRKLILPRALLSAVEFLGNYGTPWAGYLAYSPMPGEREIFARHSPGIEKLAKELQEAVWNYTVETFLAFAPHTASIHFPFQTLIDRGLPEEAPDPFDYV
ncbi:MAG: hypothetical protein HQL80_12305 [Magnetococcales bacterium]|nr:hypothetical protein [Magnetococcales bacterium]